MIPEYLNTSWPRLDSKKLVRIDGMFSLCKDTQNYSRGAPPLVVLINNVFFVTAKNYWKRGYQALKHLQEYELPDLEDSSIMTWIQASLLSNMPLPRTKDATDATDAIDTADAIDATDATDTIPVSPRTNAQILDRDVPSDNTVTFGTESDDNEVNQMDAIDDNHDNHDDHENMIHKCTDRLMIEKFAPQNVISVTKKLTKKQRQRQRRRALKVPW